MVLCMGFCRHDTKFVLKTWVPVSIFCINFFQRTFWYLPNTLTICCWKYPTVRFRTWLTLYECPINKMNATRVQIENFQKSVNISCYRLNSIQCIQTFQELFQGRPSRRDEIFSQFSSPRLPLKWPFPSTSAGSWTCRSCGTSPLERGPAVVCSRIRNSETKPRSAHSVLLPTCPYPSNCNTNQYKSI